VTVDGNPAPVAETRELGLLVHGVVLDVPRDGVAVVRFSLSGTLPRVTATGSSSCRSRWPTPTT
jgi:hypothetical protein